MALPQEDWLHLAKRLPMGGRGRHQHGRERRESLQVGNEVDRYWAYCQSCKEGGVVMKEHVRITGIAAPSASNLLTLPSDMRRSYDLTKAEQDGLLGLLASKNMDALYLPELWFSKERMRMLLQHKGEWLGRDTTGKSQQKWLTYGAQTYLDGPERFPLAVVVEDPFSFFKARWALRDAGVTVYSSLGTRVNDKLMVHLLKHDTVGFFYDGDNAGAKGAATESKRLRGMGVLSVSMCAYTGQDPKDMTIEAIREWVDNL